MLQYLVVRMLFKAMQAIDSHSAVIVARQHCIGIERKLTTQQLCASRRRVHNHCVQAATFNTH